MLDHSKFSWGTVVHEALPVLHLGALEITLTVSLKQ